MYKIFLAAVYGIFGFSHDRPGESAAEKILKNALLLVAPSIGCHILSFVACAALLLMALCFSPVSIIPAILLYPALFNLIVTFGAYGNIKRYVISERQPEES